MPDENAIWQLEDSSAIQLVPAEGDGLHVMIWQVSALAHQVTETMLKQVVSVASPAPTQFDRRVNQEQRQDDVDDRFHPGRMQGSLDHGSK